MVLITLRRRVSILLEASFGFGVLLVLIVGCFLVSENLDVSRPSRSGVAASTEGGGWVSAMRENQVLKVGMDNMRMRVSELEKECWSTRQEIEKLGRERSTWGSVSKKFGLKFKSQMCSAQEVSVSDENCGNGKAEKAEKLKDRHGKQSKILSGDGMWFEFIFMFYCISKGVTPFVSI